jgi:TonB family protein
MKQVWPVAIAISIAAHAALIAWLPGWTEEFGIDSKDTITLGLVAARSATVDSAIAEEQAAQQQPDTLAKKVEKSQPSIPVVDTTNELPVSATAPTRTIKPEQEQEQFVPMQTAVNHSGTERVPARRSKEATHSEPKLNVTSVQQHQREIKLWLQQALYKQMSYPPSARRRGWEGNLDVTIEMNPNGQFTVDILTPARRVVFDKAAMAALARVNASSRYCCVNETIQLALTIGFQLD